MRLTVLVLTILMAKVMVTSIEGTFPHLVPYHLGCYSERDLEGELISAVGNIRDLTSFNDTISSCIVTGIWLLYNLPGFRGKFTAMSGENKAFTPSLYMNVSSIRKIGSEDTFSNELVLFQKTSFQESKNLTFSEDKENFPKGTVVQSAIVKGFSDWTMVSNGLNEICLKANKNGAAFFSAIDTKDFGTLKSIYQGCEGTILEGEVQILEQGDSETEQKECGCNVGYQGEKCKYCSNGFYKVGDECRNCNCDFAGAGGDISCDPSGNCKCVGEFTGKRCDQCTTGCFRTNSTCQLCGCNNLGTLNGDTNCDPNGKCRCDNSKYFTGDKCNQCIHGFYKNGGSCQNCECFVYGVNNSDTSCDPAGNCNCDHANGYKGKKCDQCIDGYHPGGLRCKKCHCNIHGVRNSDTSCRLDGKCHCDHKNGYTGHKCQKCRSKFYRDGIKCKSCNCIGDRMNGNCKAKGVCECIKGYRGLNCDKCCPGYYEKDGSCKECDCKKLGMTGFCGSDGVCQCLLGYEGGHCQYCSYGYNRDGAYCCPLFGHCYRPNILSNVRNFKCI